LDVISSGATAIVTLLGSVSIDQLAKRLRVSLTSEGDRYLVEVSMRI